MLEISSIEFFLHHNSIIFHTINIILLVFSFDFVEIQLSFSPTTPGWSHFRLVTLLSSILVLSGFMFIICVGVGFFGGFNTFAFMAAEVSLSIIKNRTHYSR